MGGGPAAVDGAAKEGDGGAGLRVLFLRPGAASVWVVGYVAQAMAMSVSFRPQVDMLAGGADTSKVEYSAPGDGVFFVDIDRSGGRLHRALLDPSRDHAERRQVLECLLFLPADGFLVGGEVGRRKAVISSWKRARPRAWIAACRATTQFSRGFPGGS
ncbi:hypothetical protein [Embleya sp. NBC_00896]|uniref:hypothetical protein n=1 Tax=Embleya sp. NBC_00896 TaxID=2975961 RepID=UPI003868ED06|nr:hypothetical protein OG928_46635 [Embleya sp. NBC_00896]